MRKQDWMNRNVDGKTGLNEQKCGWEDRIEWTGMWIRRQGWMNRNVDGIHGWMNRDVDEKIELNTCTCTCRKDEWNLRYMYMYFILQPLYELSDLLFGSSTFSFSSSISCCNCLSHSLSRASSAPSWGSTSSSNWYDKFLNMHIALSAVCKNVQCCTCV